jgi:preprotein translocase subunit Sss1
MYHLVSLFPPAARVGRLPLSRDQLMLLMAAVNELFIAVDVFLAHNISGELKPNEWIPIIFGAVAGVLLLLAGLIALRSRPVAASLATLVFIGSIIVGLLGAYLHLNRTLLLEQPLGTSEAVNILAFAPPFLGPMFFALVGVLGISAAWREDPPDSGRLTLPFNRHVQMPYSKTRAYFFIVSLFVLATVISSVLDHTRFNLANPWVWLPTVAGLFAVAVAFLLGAIRQPSRGDLMTYTTAMVLLIVVGLIGFVLHLNSSLFPRGLIVVERFLRGSPLLSPLLFANVGLLGLLVLLDPSERR